MLNDIVPVSDPVRRATFGDQLRRNAQRHPERPAVVGYGGPHGEGRTQLTFAELNERANRLANALAAQGAVKGDVMALMGRNNPGSIVAFWAAAKLGVAVTGVNFTFTDSELHYQLEHSGAKIVVCEDAFFDRIDAISSPLPELRIRVSNDFFDSAAPQPWQRMSGLIESASADEPDSDVDESTLGIIPYTSGTTSLPKAIAIPQRNYFVSMIPSYTTGIGLLEEDVWYFTMPLHTIAGIGMQICLLSLGNTIVLPFAVDADEALDAIVAEKVTVVGQTPTFYLQLIRSPKFAAADLHRLRRCISYGGTMPQAMFDAFETVAPDVLWITLWSQSEITQTPTIGRFKRLADIPNGDAAWIGRPTAQLEVRVVDEDGNPAAEGELIVRTPGAMAGYYKDPERTAKVVRDGWIHTNDMVRIDDEGNLYFVDRRNDVIKTGGMNVSSVEVERTLYGHPAVQEVAVVGLADPYWMQVVTAFVVPKGSVDEVDVEDIRAFCKKTLAGYKIPKEIHLVSALPKDTQGKILKRQLRRDAEVQPTPASP
ncbi:MULTISPECIES: AMP-binding protein [unclassified Nocardioides]|uniref:class I adenylate-forming enzyme family protein n=1 Tax=unclassified Nocardioides TaxID=2615069 RepID=UPI0000571527|nr:MULTISPECIES: AMP-binding protein [unclassified Nocardioides]ABL80325.1 AMP-dependent synthetase and ligase [Nocardioides sp. JS614]